MDRQTETPDDAQTVTLVSMGRVCNLLGLTPQLVRAWERRYAAIEPQRTAGGTRRYGAQEIKRLRLLKTLVDHGTRIGSIASLSTDHLEARVESLSTASMVDIEPIMSALEQLDAAKFERLIFAHFEHMGPQEFVHCIAGPLVQTIGDRWERGQLSVASEHLASSTLRSLLGSSLLGKARGTKGPVLLFATTQGERHEFGILFAALVAGGAGAKVIYLGVDLPLTDIHEAVKRTKANALALSMVHGTPTQCAKDLKWLRNNIDNRISIFVGGTKAGVIAIPDGVEQTTDLTSFAEQVTLISDMQIT